MFRSLLRFAVVVVLALAGCVQETTNRPPPLSTEAARLIALAPAFDKNSFGAGVDVTIFKPTFLLGESRVVDNTLYLLYNTTDSPYKRLGTLAGGRLRTIPLSHDYYQVTFENDNRLISAVRPDGTRDWYALQRGGAVPAERPDSQRIGVPLHVLADGDSCVEGMDGTPSALDEIRAHRRISVLSMQAFVRATGGAMSRVAQAACDHFHGHDYVTTYAPGLIFRLDRGRAGVIGRGWIEAANERHILIVTNAALVDADAR